MPSKQYEQFKRATTGIEEPKLSGCQLESAIRAGDAAARGDRVKLTVSTEKGASDVRAWLQHYYPGSFVRIKIEVPE